MILDTGILIAAAIKADHYHEAAKGVLGSRGPKVIPEPVIGETCYMLARFSAAAETEFVRCLLTRTFVVEPVTRADRERIVELLTSYQDARLGYVDASVIAIAERAGETVIATLDRRDFSIVRPKHVEAFTLVP